MKKDKDGYVFIDRNGSRFEVILNWLQTGDISNTEGTALDLLRKDATFFNVWSFFTLWLLTCAASRAD